MTIKLYSQAQAKRYMPFLSEVALRHCDSVAFARSFEYIETELERTEYAPTKSEMFIPSGSFGVPKGAKTVTYRIVTDLGKPKFIDPKSDDLPRVDVDAAEFSVDTAMFGEEYAWDVGELNAIAMDPTIRLDVERKRSALDASRRFHDELAAIGSTTHAKKGFLNSTLVPLVSPITGTWSGATADQIIGDVLKLVNAPRIATLDIHKADTLLVDDTSWSYITKPRANTDTTIREWLLKNIDGLNTIEPWSRLNLGNAAGNGPRLMAYKKDPSVARYYNIVMLDELQPQYRNLKVVTPCYGVTGFTNIRRPKAMAYMDGI